MRTYTNDFVLTCSMRVISFILSIFIVTSINIMPPFYFILFYFILFYFVLYYSNQFYSILFYPHAFYSILFLFLLLILFPLPLFLNKSIFSLFMLIRVYGQLIPLVLMETETVDPLIPVQVEYFNFYLSISVSL